MQEHGGQAATDAITAPEREVLKRVLVDWNKNGQYDHELSDLSDLIQEVHLDRSLNGSAPEEARIVQGAAAAKADVTLSGEYNGLNAVATFSTFNPDSPFYGAQIMDAEIMIEFGIETEAAGTVWYPQFVGNVREIRPSRGNGVVGLNALDRVEILRSEITLPPWAYSYSGRVNWGAYESQASVSDWVIDSCIRQCGVSTTPYRPAKSEEVAWAGEFGNPAHGPQVYLTGHNGYIPTVGWPRNVHSGWVTDVDLSSYPSFRQGGLAHPDLSSVDATPRSLAAKGDYSEFSSLNDTFQVQVLDPSFVQNQGVHVLGLTILTDGDHGSYVYGSHGNVPILDIGLEHPVRVTLIVNGGNVFLALSDDSGDNTFLGSSISLPTSSSAIVVRGIADFQDLSSVRTLLTVEGTASTGWETHGAITEGTPQVLVTQAYVTAINHRIGTQDLCYAYTTGTIGDPTFDIAFRDARYPSSLDEGAHLLRYVPQGSSPDAWSAIVDAANAEFGSVLWDESGVFRFWNLDTMLSKQNSVVRTLTLDDVSDLNITHTLDSVFNVYQYKTYSQYERASELLYESSAQDEFHVPPESAREWVLSERGYPIEVNLTPGSYIYSSSDWNSIEPQNGYVLSVDSGSGGAWSDAAGSVEDSHEILVYVNHTGQMVMRFSNNHGFYSMRLRTEGGEPAFRITALGRIDQIAYDSYVRHASSSQEYGRRMINLDSMWHQQDGGVQDTLIQIARRTAEPLPQTDSIEINGDPRLQLGDTIEILDPNGLGDFVRLQITGITRDFTRQEGLKDTLTVEMIKTSGEWILGDPTYSVLGESTIL